MAEDAAVTENGLLAAPLYATGWLKRGPNGVILTNVDDAKETATSLLADRASGALSGGSRECAGGEAVRAALATQGKPLLSFDDWMRLDALEVARGKAAGKVREKIVSIEEMLEAAAAGGS